MPARSYIALTYLRAQTMNQSTKTFHVKVVIPKSKRKSRDELNAQARNRKRQKKHSGHRSGFRTQASAESKKSSVQIEKDPRIGSKIAVPLLIENKVETATKRVLATTPQLSLEEELSLLENDERLDKLLDRLDNDEILSKDDQAYVELTLGRIDVLMGALGIDFDDEKAQEDKQEDVLQLLQSANSKNIF